MEEPKVSEVRAVDAVKASRIALHKHIRGDVEKGTKQMHDYFEDDVA